MFGTYWVFPIKMSSHFSPPLFFFNTYLSFIQINWLLWEDAIAAGSLTKKPGFFSVLNALRLIFIINKED